MTVIIIILLLFYIYPKIRLYILKLTKPRLIGKDLGLVALFPSLYPLMVDHNIKAIQKEADMAWHYGNICSGFRPKHYWSDSSENLKKLVHTNGWMHGWQLGLDNKSYKHNKWLNYGLLTRAPGTNPPLLPFVHNVKSCPETIKILNKIPNIKLAGFSIMLPHSELRPHEDNTGLSTNSISVHLGLVVPDGCTLLVYNGCNNRVDDFTPLVVEEKNKQLLAFDSVYTHRAFNRSNTYRILLYIDLDIN